jgi:chromate reductase
MSHNRDYERRDSRPFRWGRDSHGCSKTSVVMQSSMSSLDIVAISGTSRPGNVTHHALAVTAEELRSRGHTVKVIDARNLTLGFPGHTVTKDARDLFSAVRASQGVVLATPEYHGTFCAMTKLIIENLGFPSGIAGKPVVLIGVASGRIGAIKSVEHLKAVMSHIGALVVPGGISLAGVESAFDQETGVCKDPSTESALRGVAASLLTFMQNYVCPKYILEQQVRENPGVPEVLSA